MSSRAHRVVVVLAVIGSLALATWAAPASPSPAASQPATASGPASKPATVKGPWADAKVGATLKTKEGAGCILTAEVTYVDADTVTVVYSREPSRYRQQVYPRMFTPEMMVRWEADLGKRVGEETVTVGIAEFKCQIYERRSEALVGGDVETIIPACVTRTWVCKGIPGWIVREDHHSADMGPGDRQEETGGDIVIEFQTLKNDRG